MVYNPCILLDSVERLKLHPEFLSIAQPRGCEEIDLRPTHLNGVYELPLRVRPLLGDAAAPQSVRGRHFERDDRQALEHDVGPSVAGWERGLELA